jgi:hypothetical protein
MGHILVDLNMALKALLGTRVLRLGAGLRDTRLVHVVARGAVHTLFEVLGLLPVEVLLVMALGELVSVKIADGPSGK